MADLINAVTIGTLTGGGGGGIVFPTVLIPVYGVPRWFLIHSYSLIGLLRDVSRPPKPAESFHYGLDPDKHASRQLQSARDMAEILSRDGA
jgi:hypothetical protein